MQRGKQNSFQSAISKRGFDIQNFESCKGLARNVDCKECASVEILYFERKKVIDMKTKIRIVNGEKYVPVCKEKAVILQEANVPLYRIGNLKTLFLKVNMKGVANI